MSKSAGSPTTGCSSFQCRVSGRTGCACPVTDGWPCGAHAEESDKAWRCASMLNRGYVDVFFHHRTTATVDVGERYDRTQGGSGCAIGTHASRVRSRPCWSPRAMPGCGDQDATRYGSAAGAGSGGSPLRGDGPDQLWVVDIPYIACGRQREIGALQTPSFAHRPLTVPVSPARSVSTSRRGDPWAGSRGSRSLSERICEARDIGGTGREAVWCAGWDIRYQARRAREPPSDGRSLQPTRWMGVEMSRTPG